MKTKTGREVLKKLPPETKFKGYDMKPDDEMLASYDPREGPGGTIYIPNEYTSEEAAPTAAHEAVHAYQCVKEKRPDPKNPRDKIDMEVEATNIGLDVAEESGRGLPQDAADMVERADDPKAFEQRIRKDYMEHYKIK